MADAFISYRRKPSAALAQLIKEKLKNQHGIDAYLDVTRADSTKVTFPERLMQAIADCPTFICLLSETTLESEWVRKEIRWAFELKKHCIPVFQESYTLPETIDEAVDYLLSFDGVQLLDIRNVFVDEAVAQIAALTLRYRSRRILWLALVGIAMLLVIFGITAYSLGLGRDNKTPTENTEIAQSFSETPSRTATDTLTTSETESTEAALAPEDTATPTDTPEIPTLIALTDQAVTHNADWVPIIQEFDGVEMVLVPVGCFLAPSQVCFDQPFWIDRYEVTNAQFSRLEGQAAEASYWTDSNRPREQITWAEAQIFCEKRGAYLPSDIEWEFAAQGPDNLVYPWGNGWDPENTVWNRNQSQGTANVGSKPDGTSWVGAYDMSGNVAEWIKTDALTVRGGSWFDSDPISQQVDVGLYDPAGEGESFSSVGFRCARSYE